MVSADTSYAYCATCGIIAPLGQLAAKPTGHYCPACAPDPRWNDRRFLAETIRTLTKVGVYFTSLTLLSRLRWLSFSEAALLAAATLAVSTATAILGQAATATFVGEQVGGLIFGRGQRVLLRGQLRQTYVELRANPFGGSCVTSPGNLPRRHQVITAGGALAQLLVLVPVYLWEPSGTDTAIRWFILIVGAQNAAHGLIRWPTAFGLERWISEHINLVPQRTSDIHCDLRSATATQEERLQLATKAFASDPDWEINRLRLGQELAGQQRWDDAVEIMAPLEYWREPSDVYNAHLLALMSMCAILTFEPHRLEQADRWSGQAEVLAPVVPVVSVVRGAVHVLNGMPEIALPLLTRAFETLPDTEEHAKTRAWTWAFGALCAHDMSDPVTARHRYRRMLEADPETAARAEVERRIDDPVFAAIAAELETT